MLPPPKLPEGSYLWPLIQALERACWSRKWSHVQAARRGLELHIGRRPHDPLFKEVEKENDA
jgi:hypothetical protein